MYTALLGGYEELLEQPVAKRTDIPFICFTDDPDLRSETWRIVLVEPMLPLDLVRSQRDFKIRGHQALEPFTETLYIDNSVLLKVPPEEILDEWLRDADYAVSLHSYRERVIDEFDEVVALNYDDAARVQEQLLHYADLYPELIHQHPYWNGMIARRMTPQVQSAMMRWFDHVLRYSRRDQLSANVALGLSGMRVNAVELDNFASELHAWPVQVARKIHLGKNNRRNAGPILAEVARLKREVSALSSELEASAEARESLADVQRELAETREAAARDRARIEGELRAQLQDVLTSTSWKASAPIRWVADSARRVRAGRSAH
ncbi:glycosyltransferase domain-containing protein [Leifsonia virtsii]|uniref:DUF616 domain-containing protein n=1 Tax=Leifsonia virtsii TaxID=3035915 RepID=A0ABT8IZY6_9MICO|nr:glycosyltransferase domain-containing protein [Leifsonia virtsii]MDN4598391.1 DUF616 domain-containing protein [Leifsonia virtsii]